MPIPFLRAAYVSAVAVVGLAGQSVTFAGREVPLAELPLPAQAVAAAWQPLAETADYRLVLAADAQVLLVLNDHYARPHGRGERPDLAKLLDDLEATTAAVDALLGAADPALPPAVVVAATTPDYPAVLARVAAIDPRLAAWADARGRNVTGFVLSEPLCAAWLDDGVGQQEWDRHNELVHRAAQLLLRRRAPQLPPWFALGFAWHVEDLVRGSIYCFPHRTGFVWATEHGDWGKQLAADFKPAHRKAAGLPAELTIEEIADWDPQREAPEFDARRACIAFGIVRFLAVQHPDALATVARAFDEAIRSGWVVTLSDTEWTTNPDYRLPADRQLAILRAVDPDLLQALTTAFAKDRIRRPAHRRP
ncbi:MAG: hypothetical protein IPM29_13715 [Planctomycetes bacterium]|nr:hypothetical protein [Planctomycetota bacterium]